MKVAWSTGNEKNWDMLHLLGRHGGTMDEIKVPYFGTLLQSLASQAEVEKCKMLLEDCNVNINANGGHYGTALQAAVKSQSRELVRLLLDHGADPNIIGGEFGTTLHAAVVCGRVDLCSMLIDANADLNAVSGGDTALHLAARNKHNKLVKLLLEKGANPAAVGADGRTALLLAAASGQESWVKLLLSKYGSMNENTSNGNIALSLAAANAVVDADGRTALHLAATNGHHAVVRLLLKSAASSAALDKEGRTALHLAAMNGHDGVVRLLLETGASSDTTLRQVAATRHERLLMLLAEADGGINRKDSNGDVPLSLAAANEHKAVVSLLLVSGADIVSCGDAVLRIAIRTKDISLVEVLIKKGADVNATDPNGQTILQLALLKGTGDIVRLLRDHGAHTTWDQHHDRRRESPWVDAWKYSSNPSAGWE
jgi:ankyrin repeat protein